MPQTLPPLPPVPTNPDEMPAYHIEFARTLALRDAARSANSDEAVNAQTAALQTSIEYNRQFLVAMQNMAETIGPGITEDFVLKVLDKFILANGGTLPTVLGGQAKAGQG